MPQSYRLFAQLAANAGMVSLKPLDQSIEEGLGIGADKCVAGATFALLLLQEPAERLLRSSEWFGRERIAVLRHSFSCRRSSRHPSR